jgi:HlyD family secretion protein/alpha/beta hydrolase family protein
MISEHDRQVLSQLPAWNPTGDVVAQRRAWEELATVYNQDLPAIGGLEQNVELRSGLRADVAVPKAAGPHPAVIYLHGGGWAFGSPTSHRKLGMQFAEAGYLTIVLDYRLAPEHPFPAALEDTVDLVLVSPRSGRVQYRLARAGEVVAAGQRILTILDLNDVYMTIYLPADDAGKLTLGDEARVIADPIPQYVIPATISFVATDAQFTPKSVETAEERQKLMFRVKLQGEPKVLDKYHRFVKTGVRGLGFVRTDPKIAWPEELVVKLPQ